MTAWREASSFLIGGRRPGRRRASYRVVVPAPVDVWEHVFHSDPDAVATQSHAWATCLVNRTGSLDASRLYEFDDGRRLVLPAAGRLRRPTAGSRRQVLVSSSWPHGWGYGGLLAQDGALTPDDVNLVMADLTAEARLSIRVVPMPLRAPLYAGVVGRGIRRSSERTQVVPLHRLADAWAALRHQARGGIRRAQREGVEITEHHAGAGVDVFADLYERSVDRWAAQRGQPVAVTRLLARRRDVAGQVAAVSRDVGDACRIWTATWRGEPVAANVVLTHGRHALGWVSAMDSDLARRTQGTYLLHWETLLAAQLAAVDHFHLGESDAGSPVEKFKRQFAAQSVDYDVLTYEALAIQRGARMARAAVVAALQRRSRG